MKATQIRKGQVIRHNNGLYRVMQMDHVTPGKGRAHVQTKLRNLIDGTQTEARFRSDEEVEGATIEVQNMQFLYDDADGFHFMNVETYDQVALQAETLGDARQYLIPDQTVQVQWNDGRPIGVELPSIVELKVVECPPGVKDATASAQRKQAKMETGLVILVPAFIEEGETLRVNTLDGTYSERAK